MRQCVIAAVTAKNERFIRALALSLTISVQRRGPTGAPSCRRAVLFLLLHVTSLTMHFQVPIIHILVNDALGGQGRSCCCSCCGDGWWGRRVLWHPDCSISLILRCRAADAEGSCCHR